MLVWHHTLDGYLLQCTRHVRRVQASLSLATGSRRNLGTILVSRTISDQPVVDEMILTFIHTVSMDWMLRFEAFGIYGSW